MNIQPFLKLDGSSGQAVAGPVETAGAAGGESDAAPGLFAALWSAAVAQTAPASDAVGATGTLPSGIVAPAVEPGLSAVPATSLPEAPVTLASTTDDSPPAELDKANPVNLRNEVSKEMAPQNVPAIRQVPETDLVDPAANIKGAVETAVPQVLSNRKSPRGAVARPQVPEASSTRHQVIGKVEPRSGKGFVTKAVKAEAAKENVPSGDVNTTVPSSPALETALPLVSEPQNPPLAVDVRNVVESTPQVTPPVLPEVMSNPSVTIAPETSAGTSAPAGAPVVATDSGLHAETRVASPGDRIVSGQKSRERVDGKNRPLPSGPPRSDAAVVNFEQPHQGVRASGVESRGHAEVESSEPSELISSSNTERPLAQTVPSRVRTEDDGSPMNPSMRRTRPVLEHATSPFSDHPSSVRQEGPAPRLNQPTEPRSTYPEETKPDVAVETASPLPPRARPELTPETKETATSLGPGQPSKSLVSHSAAFSKHPQTDREERPSVTPHSEMPDVVFSEEESIGETNEARIPVLGLESVPVSHRSNTVNKAVTNQVRIAPHGAVFTPGARVEVLREPLEDAPSASRISNEPAIQAAFSEMPAASSLSAVRDRLFPSAARKIEAEEAASAPDDAERWGGFGDRPVLPSAPSSQEESRNLERPAPAKNSPAAVSVESDSSSDALALSEKAQFESDSTAKTGKQPSFSARTTEANNVTLPRPVLSQEISTEREKFENGDVALSSTGRTIKVAPESFAKATRVQTSDPAASTAGATFPIRDQERAGRPPLQTRSNNVFFSPETTTSSRALPVVEKMESAKPLDLQFDPVAVKEDGSPSFNAQQAGKAVAQVRSPSLSAVTSEAPGVRPTVLASDRHIERPALETSEAPEVERTIPTSNRGTERSALQTSKASKVELTVSTSNRDTEKPALQTSEAPKVERTVPTSNGGTERSALKTSEAPEGQPKLPTSSRYVERPVFETTARATPAVASLLEQPMYSSPRPDTQLTALAERVPSVNGFTPRSAETISSSRVVTNWTGRAPAATPVAAPTAAAAAAPSQDSVQSATDWVASKERLVVRTGAESRASSTVEKGEPNRETDRPQTLGATHRSPPAEVQRVVAPSVERPDQRPGNVDARILDRAPTRSPGGSQSLVALDQREQVGPSSSRNSSIEERPARWSVLPEVQTSSEKPVSGSRPAPVQIAISPAASGEARELIREPEMNSSFDNSQRSGAGGQVEENAAAQAGPRLAGKHPAVHAEAKLAGFGNQGRLNHGTSVAQSQNDMSLRPNRYESAGSDEQELPDRSSTAVGLEEAPGLGSVEAEHELRAPGHLDNPTWQNGLSEVNRPSRDLDLDGTDKVAKAPTHERLLHLVQSEVQLVRSTKADRLSVVLRPDNDTEILLRLRVQDGAIEAHARCDRGNYAALNSQWGDLQEALSACGVRLAPLTVSMGSGYEWQNGSQTRFDSSSSFNQPRQSQHPPSSASQQQQEGTSDQPRTRQAQSRGRRSSHQLLELWA